MLEAQNNGIRRYHLQQPAKKLQLLDTLNDMLNNENAADISRCHDVIRRTLKDE
jgi:hypothetical protein